MNLSSDLGVFVIERGCCYLEVNKFCFCIAYLLFFFRSNGFGLCYIVVITSFFVVSSAKKNRFCAFMCIRRSDV